MKKIIVLLMTMILMLACMPSFACKDNSQFNIANTRIKDFSSFESLGVAEKEVSSAQNNNNNTSSIIQVYADAVNYNLIGITKEGEFCDILFIDDNGKEIHQTWSLYDIYSIGRFIFITFSNDGEFCMNYNPQGSFSFELYSGNGRVSFLIDQKTGKVYSLEEISQYLDRIERNVAYGHTAYNEDILYVLDESHDGYRQIYSIYKWSFEQERLIVQEVVNSTVLNFYDRDIMTDKYGHLYLRQARNSDSPSQMASYDLMITNQGRIRYFTHKLGKALNGEVYLYNNGSKVDENGNVVTATDTCNLFYNGAYPYLHYLCKKDGSEYYLEIASLHGGKIYINKVTWMDETNYVSEIVAQGKYDYDKYLIANEKVYFLKDTFLYYYGIDASGRILSDYFLSDIKKGYNDTLLFSALDEELNVVEGIVFKDHTILYSTEANNFRLMEAVPIN